MSDPSNVDGARHGAAPRMTVFPSEVSVWLAEKASQLRWPSSHCLGTSCTNG